MIRCHPSFSLGAFLGRTLAESEVLIWVLFCGFPKKDLWKPVTFWLPAAAAKSLQSDSVRPHTRQPTRLPHPWDSPGKNTGVGCHFLLQCMNVKSDSEVAQLCSTLSDRMDCSPPGSSIHGIFQARVLEWGAIDCLDPFYFCSLSATPGPFSKFFLRGFLLFLLVLKWFYFIFAKAVLNTRKSICRNII